MKTGDRLIAHLYCGFPDGTVQGEVYVVSRVMSYGFFVTDKDGNEIFPISTTFKKEAADE